MMKPTTMMRNATPLWGWVLFFSLFCINPLLGAQTSTTTLAWQELRVPSSGSAELTQAATAPARWQVASAANKLNITLWKPQTEHRLSVSGGTFVSSATDERGFAPLTPVKPKAKYYGLSFEPAGGGTPYRVIDEDINMVFTSHGQTYALGGVREAASSSGHLWILKRKNGIWTATWIIDFTEPAYAVTESSTGLLYIICRARLYEADLAKRRITIIYENAFWSKLRPESAVWMDGTIHIGMQGGVASLDIARRVIAWTARALP